MSDLKEQAARYALLKYLSKRINDECKLLQADSSGSMRELYDATGATQVTAEVGGCKVGKVTARVCKESSSLEVNDPVALWKWAEVNGMLIAEPDMAAIARHYEDTGEVPDGCEVVAKPGGFGGISVTHDKESKANIAALAGRQSLAALLDPKAPLQLEDGGNAGE